MSLNRTLTATCDRIGCTESIALDPLDIQPWHSLNRAGWRFDLLTDSQPTYCPDHDGATA